MAAEKGNKYAQEWTFENALPRFEDALKFAKENDDCLCLQDAILQTGIPVSTFKYLVENQKVLASIKEEIHAVIISRINKGALRDTLTSTPAIWRMKQLGEKDQSHLDVKSDGEKITGINYIIPSTDGTNHKS